MDEIPKQFIKVQKDMWKSFGLDDLSSEIFGIVYIMPENIPMDDLVELTGYSLSTISNKVKFLATIGIITKTRIPFLQTVMFTHG